MILKKSNNNAIQNKYITIKTWIDIEYYVYVFTCFACYWYFYTSKNNNWITLSALTWKQRILWYVKQKEM